MRKVPPSARIGVELELRLRKVIALNCAIPQRHPSLLVTGETNPVAKDFRHNPPAGRALGANQSSSPGGGSSAGRFGGGSPFGSSGSKSAKCPRCFHRPESASNSNSPEGKSSPSTTQYRNAISNLRPGRTRDSASLPELTHFWILCQLEQSSRCRSPIQTTRSAGNNVETSGRNGRRTPGIRKRLKAPTKLGQQPNATIRNDIVALWEQGVAASNPAVPTGENRLVERSFGRIASGRLARLGAFRRPQLVMGAIARYGFKVWLVVAAIGFAIAFTPGADTIVSLVVHQTLLVP